VGIVMQAAPAGEHRPARDLGRCRGRREQASAVAANHVGQAGEIGRVAQDLARRAREHQPVVVEHHAEGRRPPDVVDNGHLAFDHRQRDAGRDWGPGRRREGPQQPQFSAMAKCAVGKTLVTRTMSAALHFSGHGGLVQPHGQRSANQSISSG
jgi:hypothetical protein